MLQREVPNKGASKFSTTKRYKIQTVVLLVTSVYI
jgi:hypothetical protein